MLRTLLAVAAVGGMTSASIGADEIRFSDFDVRLAAHAQPEATIGGAVRAAFLSDEEIEMLFPPGVARQPVMRNVGNVSSVLPRPLSGGFGTDCDCGTACDCDAATGCGDSCDVACEGCESCDCAANGGAGCGRCSQASQRSIMYGEVQLLWLRAHVMEDAVGKLSEQYEFSPRLIAGCETCNGIGARGRFWHYGHQSEFLGDSDGIRFDLDVIDIEATSRFAIHRSDLVVSGGFRWTTMEIATDDTVSNNMLGLTFAADLRTAMCSSCDRQWSGICGARFSLLGGDWDGQGGGFVDREQDDNLVVQELYAGVEYLCCMKGGANLFARLVFEMQNWHSDAMAQSADTDSIGFVGPGAHFGASF
jgi:hypothetical protein